MSTVAGDKLRSFVERIEAVESEKAALASDVRDLFAEAKASGFDVKAMKAVIRLRRLDPAERQEAMALLDLYATELNLQLFLPL